MSAGQVAALIGRLLEAAQVAAADMLVADGRQQAPVDLVVLRRLAEELFIAWQALLQIPAGETRNYADIAAAVGKPDAVRAAGTANGANPVSVLIPCHRVIRSDGGLGGYAYGLERKRRLLAWESGQGGLFPA